MELVTISLAVFVGILVLYITPVYGLAIYSVISLWYPYSVGTVKVGTLDFSVGRIVIVILFIKVLFSTDLVSKFKVIWLDRLVIILFVAEVIAGLTTTDAMWLFEYRSGDFFDMALPYFAVRLIIRSKKEFITLLKIMAVSAAVLATFSIFESLTGYNLVEFGRNFGISDKRLEYFYRARTTFRHPIYFGVFSGMMGGLCMALLKNDKRHQIFNTILVILIFLGAFFSMSSGGLLAMVGGLGFIAFYKFRHYWKQGIIMVIVMCGIVEMISNRHFYDVIDRFTFNAQTAWYRSRLFEVAFFEGGMSDHWIFGYGYVDPRWCDKIDMRNHTDMVNHYLLVLSRYGLVGFVPFCAVILVSLRILFKGFWKVYAESDRWLIWCLGGALASVLLAFHSVSLFGQPMIMLFMIFGFCGIRPLIINTNNYISMNNNRC